MAGEGSGVGARRVSIARLIPCGGGSPCAWTPAPPTLDRGYVVSSGSGISVGLSSLVRI